MRKIADKKGFTLAELIVSMAVVSIFVLSLTMVLSVGCKLYLTQTARGNTQVAIETLSDDMKGYIMYGTDIKVIYVLSGSETTIAGYDVSGMAAGTEIYMEKDDTTTDIWGVFTAPGGSPTRDVLPSPEDFVGNGIDLGFKKLYLTETTDGVKYVKGLSYDLSYYRGLNLDLHIRDMGFTDASKAGIYEIDISGEASTGYLQVKSNVAITGINQK